MSTDMQQQIGFQTSSSVARKAATSSVGQVGDEADGIGEDNLAAVRQRDPSHGRIQGRKQQIRASTPDRSGG
jgi:hypothetical protein